MLRHSLKTSTGLGADVARKAKQQHVKVLDAAGTVAIVDRRPEHKGLIGPSAGGWVGVDDDWTAVTDALNVAAGLAKKLDGNSKGGAHSKIYLSDTHLELLREIIRHALVDSPRNYVTWTLTEWQKKFGNYPAPVISRELIKQVRKII